LNEEDYRKQMIEKLGEISSKIDALMQLIAITSRKETIEKAKTKTDQIVTLDNLGVSREIIALIVGTTPESVSSLRSQLKAKKKKRKIKKADKKEQEKQ
jgi:CRP-like cAMP-binding protein